MSNKKKQPRTPKQKQVKSVEKPSPKSQFKIKEKLSINSENFIMCKVGSFDKDYMIDGKLGEGSFGTVYKVFHKSLKTVRALKTIKKRSNQHFSSFEEIEILKKLDHSNILKIYEFYDAPEDYYIITEVFEGRELFDLISDQQKLTEKFASQIMKQILRSVNYTHSLKIAHRDIKPENILIKMQENDKFKIKVIDWGLGTLLGDNWGKRVCGTPQYCAPEVLQGKYSLSCDMWSIGVIAYVMLTGQMPFVGNNTEETINEVKKGIIDKSSQCFKLLNPDSQDFIEKLVDKNPNARLTAPEALQHKWIKKYEVEQKQPVFLKETLERLRFFTVTNSFGMAVVSFISNYLSEQKQKEKLEQIFKHLDKNSDGVLSLEELTQGYSELYGTELGGKIAEQTFEKLDINNNGTLEFSEFVTFGLEQRKEKEKIKLRQAFNLFDKDKNGKISLEEIQQVLKGKIDSDQEEDIKQIIEQIDQNGDNEIDFNEFMNCIKKINLKKNQKEKKNKKVCIQ